jgi:rod shape-determining protein MreD
MRGLRFLFALLCVVLIHIVGMRLFPNFARYFDVFLVLVVFHSLDGNSLAGMLGGLAVGLVHDGFSGGLFGLHGFADTLVGYAVARAAQQVATQQAVVVLLLFALASAFQQTVLVGLVLFLLSEPQLPAWSAVALKALSSGALGWILYLASTQAREQWAVWSRRRTSKLRMR